MNIPHCLLLLLFPLVSLSQYSSFDSVQVLLIKFDPITMISTQSLGAELEYQPSLKYSWTSGLYASYIGFTAKTGIRTFLRNGRYLELTGFYRLRKYNDRNYEWRSDHDLSLYVERLSLIIFPASRPAFHLALD